MEAEGGLGLGLEHNAQVSLVSVWDVEHDAQVSPVLVSMLNMMPK